MQRRPPSQPRLLFKAATHLSSYHGPGPTLAPAAQESQSVQDNTGGPPEVVERERGVRGVRILELPGMAQHKIEFPEDVHTVYLHANPELSLHEVETAKLVAEKLRARGYEVTTDVGGHGVVGVLENGEGPTLLIRGDMDALPVQEATGLPYASKVKINGQPMGMRFHLYIRA